MKSSSLGKQAAKTKQFHNGSSFDDTRIILVTYARSCVLDSVSMNGSSFESILGSLSHMLRCVLYLVFTFSNLVS